MKTKLIIALVALQMAALAWMAGQREWILHAGQTIRFRTLPLDPRDPFRGDYVRLSYDMSRVPKALWRGKLAEMNPADLPADTVVHAALELGEDGVARLTGLSLEPPSQTPFLRGRTQRSTDVLQVRYGLEAFFTEQGKGLELERARRREGIQVPLDMEAAVSRGGVGVLKDFRWCPLGIGLSLETNASPPSAAERQQATAATVRLLNASSNPVAVVDLPNGRSLALVPIFEWAENPWRWAPPREPEPDPATARVVALQPGQIHEIRVSLEDPRWSVTRATSNTAPQPLARADFDGNWSRFRFEYRPPSKSSSANLTNAQLIWHGKLLSPAFHPRGSVD